MKRKSLLFLLLFALIAPWAANAQTRETLTFDFEDQTIPSTWINDATNPWVVVSESQGTGHTGTYCIKNGNSGVHSSTSTISATFTFVSDGSISFLGGCWGEGSGSYLYDKCIFSIDGTEQFTYGARDTWETYSFEVSAGEHTFTWSYSKDSSVNATGDAFYVDDIVVNLGVAGALSKPTNLACQLTPGNGTIATLSWTENGTATAWEIMLNNDETNLIAANSNPFTLTNLTPETSYTACVRATDGTNQSSWSNSVTFVPTNDYRLTVNEGTVTNSYVPYFGYYHDSQQRSEFIIPASSISALNGYAITSMKFYAGYNYSTSASIQVYLKEVSEGTFSNTTFYTEDGATTVYTGTLTISSTDGMTITFNDGYEYNGGNLLVGFYQASAGSGYYSSSSCPFYGVTANGASISIYGSYSATQRNFLPKVTFEFEPLSSCRKPTDLATGEVGKRNATIRWIENGVATAWQVEVTDLDGGQVTTWNANATTFEIVGLTPGTRYSVRVNPVCDVEKWSDAITFTTEVACPAPELTIVETTPVAATFSWTGEAQGYEMEYMVNPSFTFEDGTLQGWTNLIVNADGGQWLHSNDNPGGYMDPTASGNPYYPDLAHNGTGFAMCYSFIDNDGAYNTDAYLVSPRSYLINNGASMNFWYDMANDTYPEYFEVCVATAANPTADDFTAIWTSDAKGSNGQKAAVRHRNHTRYQNWREVTIDLSAYVGQTIWVAFHDVNEDMYEVWIDDVMIDDGTIEWTPAPAPIVSPYTLALEPGTEYLVRVRAICGGEDGESAWTTVTVTTPSNCDTPFDLNVTNLMPTTATLNWTGYQDGYEVRYRTPASQEVLFFEGFEGLDDQGLPEGWTSIDNDGDGNDWYGLTGFAAYAHGGDGIVTSASYAGGALTPDNWLVTPQIALQGTMKVYLRAQDPSYAAEGYAIYLSTTGNTVDDFTVELYPESFDLTGEYKEITADLSSYNGQMGYIAIRHFDCEDMFRINVDDFGIYGGETPAGEWNYVTTGDLFADIIELHPETAYEWQVRGENRSCTNGEEEGYTAWSEMGTFTTPGLCDNPNTFVFENLEATTATLTWTGYQESFNVMYRTAETYDELFYDDLEEGIDEWTTPNDDNLFTLSFTDGSSMTCYGFVGDGTTQTMISPEFESAPAGFALRFFYYAYQASIQTFNVGFSTDGENFTYIGEETTDEENYGGYYEVDVPEGAKYFAIQSSGASNYLLLGEFWIYANYVAPGDWVELTVTEPSVTMEPLTPETEYEVYVQGICGEGEDDVTNWIGGYFTTPEQTDLTQTTNLNAGWNWFSAYVEGDAVALIQALENSLGDKGITIKGSEISTDYYGEEYGWFGELDALGIVNEQMYLINVTESCTVELQGTPANPANHAITINPGWNWIGFPCAEAVSVAAALAEFPAEEGDVLKGSELSTDYYGEEFGWFGGLETLEPGQGYLYKYNGTTAQTLIFQTGAKRAATTNTLLLKKQIKDQKHNAISRKTMSTKNGVGYNKFQAKVGYNKSIAKKLPTNKVKL